MRLGIGGEESAGSVSRASSRGSSSRRERSFVAGIETHVCILQTAFDLMAIGYQVFVPADAVASRKTRDWEFALKRLSDGGATIVTTESVLFEWAEAAGTPRDAWQTPGDARRSPPR